jgi:regulator of protease activity HflC (stomatin/prohibitin superfamily)
MILEAQGEAEAIRDVQQATADGIRMLKEAGADEAVLKLKSLAAFEKVANTKATTILLPAELQGIASVAAAFKETGNALK